MAVRLGRVRRPLVRRYLWRLLRYLVAGLLSTVAMAWACTWIGASNQTALLGNMRDQAPEEYQSFSVKRSFGSELAAFELFLGEDMTPWYLKWIPVDDPPELKVVDPPYWTKARDFKYFSQEGISAEGAHGWPFKSMRWWVGFGMDLGPWEPDSPSDELEQEWPPRTIQWGITVPVSTAKLDSYEGEHILPLNPIWPGLLADTVMFAMAWAIMLLLPPALYHVYIKGRRRQRNQCESCGYSLADLPGPVCPECGKLTTGLSD